MRVSAAVVAAVVAQQSTSSLAHAKGRRRGLMQLLDGSINKIHMFKPDPPVTAAEIRPLWAQEKGDTEQTKGNVRPLWAGVESTTTEHQDGLPCDPDVGILACGPGSLCNIHGYCEEVHRSLEEGGPLSCAAYSDIDVDCDCSGFNEETGTGSFSCTSEVCDEGETPPCTAFTYAWSDVEGPDDYNVVLSYEFPDGLSLENGYTVEAGEITSCTFVAQGCECGCNVGTCPGQMEPEALFLQKMISADCPGIDLVDFCLALSIDNFVMLRNITKCDVASRPTLAPVTPASPTTPPGVTPAPTASVPAPTVPMDPVTLAPNDETPNRTPAPTSASGARSAVIYSGFFAFVAGALTAVMM